MRIVIWNTSYLKSVGGAEKMVHDHAHYYASRGFQVSIVADQPDTNIDVSQVYGPLSPHVKVYSDRFPYPFQFKARPLRLVQECYRYLSSSVRLGFFLKSQRPDIINLHYVNFDVFILTFYKWLLGYKFVISFTGGDLQLAEQNRRARSRVRWALRVADVAIGLSADMCRRLETISARPIACVYNGISLEGARSSVGMGPIQVEDDQFVFCGRLTPVKRVPFLIHAFRECVNRGCRRKLYLVGSGEEEPEIRRLITELELDDLLILVGPVAHATVLEIMRRSRCLLLTSSSEGLPNVILEAMSLGKPAISSQVGGIPEIITHGENGWLFPADSPATLCDLIMAVDQDQHLSLEAGRRAALTIEQRFSETTMMQSYERIFSRLLNQPPDSLVSANADPEVRAVST